MRQRTLAVVIFGLSLIPLLVGSAWAAPYGQGRYSNCSYSDDCVITITTTGSVSLSNTPTPSGSFTIDSDTVTVSSNSINGYTLQLANSSASEAGLVNGVNTIAAHGSTFGSPTTLATNTWGFRVDSAGGFGAGPTSTVANQPSSALTFAGVPLSAAPVQIKNYTAGSVSNDTTTVWYGIHVNNSLPSGTYTATVTYTATANP